MSSGDETSLTSVQWPKKAEAGFKTHRLYQNMDFSTFPYLVKNVYKYLKSLASRHPNHEEFFLPYCAFLHVCTGVLNAAILRQCRPKSVNALRGSLIDDKYFELELPVPIIEYIYCVAETNTILDHRVELHFPEIAIPRAYIPSVAPEIPAGSFGHADAHTRNVYECYVSPYITRRLVEATRDGDENWEPLPEHLKPAGGIPNQNLLGYDKIEELNKYQRKFLDMKKGMTGYEQMFPDDVLGVDARLHWSEYLYHGVQLAMAEMGHLYEMKPLVSYPERYRKRKNEGMIGFVRIERKNYDNDTYLAPLDCNVLSWQKFGSWLGNVQACFGLKRKRTARAPGLCYTLENKGAPSGWMEHINDNFEMKGIFEARFQEWNSQLQCANYAVSGYSRERLLDTCVKHFQKEWPYSSDEDW